MKNLVNYNEAYAEVIEVLNYIPLEDYKRIPEKYITFLKENSDENNTFTYNVALPFEKQEISDTAKNILAMIFRLFIITKEKKEELTIKDKKQEEKIIKNTEKFFKKNTIKQKENIQEQNEKALIEKRESIIKKIWNKIKSIIGK